MNFASGRQLRSGAVALLVFFVATAAPVRAEDAGTPAPLDSRQWNERGTELAGKKQWQGAVDAFTEAIKLSPKKAGLYVNRAVAYEKLEDWDKAEADCSAAIAIDPDDTNAFLQRAIVRSEMGRAQEAFKDASRAARMEPDNAQCVFIRHLTASRIGRHDLGHTAGETYIGIRGWTDTWSPYVALLNYVSLRRAGNRAGAEAILSEAAVSLSPDTWPAAVVLYLRGDVEEKDLLVLAEDPSRATLVHYYVGIRHWLDGDLPRAREQFEWVINKGDRNFLQFKLAGDHLKDMAHPPGGAELSSEKQPGQ
jgi:tetratricopeptide (TPR) repeat protein